MMTMSVIFPLGEGGAILMMMMMEMIPREAVAITKAPGEIEKGAQAAVMKGLKGEEMMSGPW